MTLWLKVQSLREKSILNDAFLSLEGKMHS